MRREFTENPALSYSGFFNMGLFSLFGGMINRREMAAHVERNVKIKKSASIFSGCVRLGLTNSRMWILSVLKLGVGWG